MTVAHRILKSIKSTVALTNGTTSCWLDFGLLHFKSEKNNMSTWRIQVKLASGQDTTWNTLVDLGIFSSQYTVQYMSATERHYYSSSLT